MLKKYFEFYTLYIGQGTLQIFANFESNNSWGLPITSSPKAILGIGDHEDSEDDSGVEVNTELHSDPEESDDQFAVLWYGTDNSDDENSTNFSDDEYGIFPDTPVTDVGLLYEDYSDISEKESDDDQQESFPDIRIVNTRPDNEHHDDTSEEEDDNDIISTI